ncbi:MAG: hypothetical protein Greene071421_593, partial [Parcubacteria group bacterium Greene0714_21]
RLVNGVSVGEYVMNGIPVGELVGHPKVPPEGIEPSSAP